MTSQTNSNIAALEAKALAKSWFYRYQLPSGVEVPTTHNGALDAIHETRLQMLDRALAPHYPNGLSSASAIDLACHQGFFSVELAKRGCKSVTALDARTEHIEDTNLIRDVYELDQIKTVQCDVHAAHPKQLGTHDIVLCFGLLYHLENPVGALRVARSLCQGVCVVETQVVPGVQGYVDWGSYRFVKPLMGAFGLIDETEETHGPEMSTTGICLAPSIEGLLWVMEKVGFKDVQLVAPHEDAYEQLRWKKRVMVIGRV